MERSEKTLSLQRTRESPADLQWTAPQVIKQEISADTATDNLSGNRTYISPKSHSCTLAAAGRLVKGR